jgi:hypothetical protein
MREVDIEDINNKVKTVLAREFPVPTEEDVKRLKPFIQDILKSNIVLPPKEFMALRKQYKFMEKNSYLMHVYLQLKKNNDVDTTNEQLLRKTLQIKPCKSWSGIVSITIFTAAYPEYTNENGERVKQSFSCSFLF